MVFLYFEITNLTFILFLGTRIKPSKLKQQTSTEGQEETKKSEEIKTDQVQVEIVDKQVKAEEKKKDEDDGVKDAWDAESSEEEPEEGKHMIVTNVFFFNI